MNRNFFFLLSNYSREIFLKIREEGCFFLLICFERTRMLGAWVFHEKGIHHIVLLIEIKSFKGISRRFFYEIQKVFEVL